jgi:hypothetical protein
MSYTTSIAAIFITVVAVGVTHAVWQGLRMRRGLEKMFMFLGTRACPKCGRLYGPGLERSSRPLVGPNDVQPAPGAVVWEITCPFCGVISLGTQFRDNSFVFEQEIRA